MPIPPVTEFEGQLPNEGEPASFPARAEALFDWLVGQGMPEFNAAIAAVNIALNDNGTVLDTAGKAIALTTNAGTLVETAGTGNAYTITPAVAIPAYEDGQTFMIRPNRANSGAVTLKVGARATVPVRKLNADGTTFAELVANDWRPGEIHIVGYRGGQFELLTTPLNRFVRNDTAQTITGPWTFNGNLGFGAASQVRAALGLGVMALRNNISGTDIAGGGVGTDQLAVAERMTTSNVLARLAGAGAGAIGSFAFLHRTSSAHTEIDAGAVYSGGELQYAGFWAEAGANGISSRANTGALGFGSWRALGAIYNRPSSSYRPVSLFQRIA